MLYGRTGCDCPVTFEEMERVHRALETGEAVGPFTRSLIEKMLVREEDLA